MSYTTPEYTPDNSIILRNHRLDALIERGTQFIKDIDAFNGLDQSSTVEQGYDAVSDIMQDSEIQAMMDGFNNQEVVNQVVQEDEVLDADALAASIDIDEILATVDQGLQL